MVADEVPGAQVHHPWLRAPLLPRAAPKTRSRSGAEDGAAPAAPCANRWSTALARAAPAGRLPEAPRARPDRCRQRQWRRV